MIGYMTLQPVINLSLEFAAATYPDLMRNYSFTSLVGARNSSDPCGRDVGQISMGLIPELFNNPSFREKRRKVLITAVMPENQLEANRARYPSTLLLSDLQLRVLRSTISHRAHEKVVVEQTRGHQ
ncbi:hypothetical protein BV898_17563 [Hypsibius exemplaris]|uniref:Uncharacterized protein n=1 Tax=Hypsibius exemplaris TaxID=2072580 RepID=A0A9X6NFB4_HYPEX|nr:hypothetical protein BV898_17563 [Hypsibius exemplaris]